MVEPHPDAPKQCCFCDITEPDDAEHRITFDWRVGWTHPDCVITAYLAHVQTLQDTAAMLGQAQELLDIYLPDTDEEQIPPPDEDDEEECD